MAPLLNVIIAALVGSISLYVFRQNINNKLGRFFRDYSRYKSRKRLYGNDAALIPILMGTEDRIELTVNDINNEDGFTMTAEELALMNGKDEDTPLYLSVLGHIYDVSANRRTYGPGKNYHGLIGHDSTVEFGLGCLPGDTGCEVLPHIDDLTAEDWREAEKWAEMYHNHDKYVYIGELVASVVDKVAEKGAREDGLEGQRQQQDVDDSVGFVPKVRTKMQEDLLEDLMRPDAPAPMNTNDDVEHVVHDSNDRVEL